MGVAVRVDRRRLEQAIKQLTSVVMRETSVELYQHILLAGQSVSLVLRGTNINCFGEVSLPLTGSGEAFTLALRPEQLLAVVSNVRADEVTLEPEGLAVTLRGGTARTLLRGPDSQGFTEFPAPRPMKRFRVTGADLARAIRRVAYATIKRDAGASLAHTVVALEAEPDPAGEGSALFLIATDSLRAALEVVPVSGLEEDETVQPEHTPLPGTPTPEERRRTQHVLASELQVLLPMLDAAGEEQVTVTLDWRMVEARSPSARFIVSVAEQGRLRVRDGMEARAAAGPAGCATVERLGLLAAIRAARAVVPLSGVQSNPLVHDDGVALAIIPGENGAGGSLLLRTGDRDGQSYHEVLPADVSAAGPIFRVVAMRYVADALGQFESARVVLNIGSGERDPLWVTAGEVEGEPERGLAFFGPRIVDESRMARQLAEEWAAHQAQAGGREALLAI